MITRKNYEIYFIEYLDGTLSEAKAAELKTFLLLNPDLSALLEDTDKAKLKAPVLIYRKKNVLKKTEIQECPDYYAIATAETVLTPEENQQLGKRKSDQPHQALPRARLGNTGRNRPGGTQILRSEQSEHGNDHPGHTSSRHQAVQ